MLSNFLHMRLLTTHYLPTCLRRQAQTGSLLTRQRGFSLIEAMVAISVLVLALTGTMTVASRSLFSSDVARDQIVAFYLAQEAVEFVRNIRDNNALAGTDWLNRLESTCTSSNCRIDVNASPPNDIVNCSGACPVLKLSSTGIYNYTNGSNTIFRREISINETVEDREATVDVTVYWQRRLNERSFTIREHIFHWK